MTVPHEALTTVLAERAVDPVFQPILSLDDDETVAYEALARGTASLRSPAELFAAARSAGRLSELDWLCRERAVERARDAAFRSPLSLFINAEPQALVDTADAERWSAMSDLRCYTEFTERALAARPAELLRAVERVREQDWGIALDDIGAAEESFALMPLLRPDVLKLDMGLLTQRADRSTVRTMHAVLAQAEETGAAVVAEGIETPQQLETARSYGVRFGQGFLLGRPGPLPDDLDFPHAAVPLLPRSVDRTVLPGPFALVASQLRTREMQHRTVVELARQLISQAQMLQPPPVVLARIPHDSLLPPSLRDALGRLASALPLAAVLPPSGTDLQLDGVRIHQLDPIDPAVPDVDVVVVSAYYAAALVARASSTHPLDERSAFDAVLTFNRQLVIGAANALLRRLDAEPVASTGADAAV